MSVSVARRELFSSCRELTIPFCLKLLKFSESKLITEIVSIVINLVTMHVCSGKIQNNLFSIQQTRIFAPSMLLAGKCSIRIAVSDFSDTEHRRLGPPYQTERTVHVHAKHNTHCDNVPDSFVTRECGLVKQA